MSECDPFLPRDGIPVTPGFEGQRLHWLDMDTRERYRQKGGHALYGENDIVYGFNRHGYRGAEFDTRADIRILAVGCSYVLGVGLPEEALFHQRFAERFRRPDRTVVAWNLGHSGASNDYINRILQLAVPRLDPHVVLVNFTHGSRREYVSVQNRLVPYNPGWSPPNRVDRDIKRHFDALSSAYDDRLNLFRNYRAIAALLSDRCWMFTTIDPWTMETVLDHVAPERYVGAMEILDLARDQAHPGARSHEALEARYWECFSDLRRKAAGFHWS
jgi:hypothetical protein